MSEVEALRARVSELESLEHENQRLANDHALLAQIGQINSSSLDIDEAYERFAERVSELVPFDRISINAVDLESNSFTISYVSGIDVVSWRPGVTAPLPGNLTNPVVQRGAGVIVQLEDKDELAERFPGLIPSYEAGLRSAIAVPVVFKDRLIGTLQLASLSRHAYSERHLRLAEGASAQIAGVLASSQLYAERKHLEQQLSQSQKMEAIGLLTGGVAHDFNNMLSAVLSYTELLMPKFTHDERSTNYLKEIQRAAERAANLTRQLLASSRQHIIAPRVLDLNDLIIDINKMLRRMIREHIELITLPAAKLDKIMADSGQIEQVLINLVLNARDAMPDGGKVIIESANATVESDYDLQHPGVDAGNYVMLSVADTGIGMSKEAQDRAFEPFFTTKEVGKGTGLGLSTCYGIVTQNGGHIMVDSEQGRGTTFRIYLPCTEESASLLPLRNDPTHLPTGSETVLLVEDELIVRQVVAEVLIQQGYNVLAAGNGVEAMRIAEERRNEDIHLLLTDMVMPLMGGRELSELFRRIHHESRVLYSSGYTDDTTLSTILAEGDAEFMQKPFTSVILAQRVREILDKR